MPCPETNPCDTCQDTNGCYDNCGCINPTTFECITEPGTLTAIGVTNDMNGKEVLQAINDTIQDLIVTPPAPGSDIYTKVSSSDTTAGYLGVKILTAANISQSVLSPGANEKVRLAVNVPQLISSDAANLIELGTDGKLRVLTSSTPAEFFVEAGSGVTVTGTGPATDPYIVSINPSITALRTCFDGTWKDVTITATGNSDVIYGSGVPKYRVRFDGSIEFKGSATYTVNFGAYSTSNRKRTVTIGNIADIVALSSGCGVSLAELAGTSDLKSINYIDQPGLGDQITQQYGYIIRKNAASVQIEFQSAFVSATSKTIVVNFEGCTIHPSF